MSAKVTFGNVNSHSEPVPHVSLRTEERREDPVHVYTRPLVPYPWQLSSDINVLVMVVVVVWTLRTHHLITLHALYNYYRDLHRFQSSGCIAILSFCSVGGNYHPSTVCAWAYP